MRRGSRWRVQDLLQGLLLALVLYTMASVVLGADMCTKAVIVRSEPSKKMHVLRRVPASCSNWEKAWSWITKKDCGTKYRLDYVDIPHSRVQYKMVRTCCEGDTKCKEAEADGLEASGLDVSDEKFLAIVLGSTAAALFLLILIISISLCRKKKQCALICEERRHIYTSAEEEADEGSELQGQKGCGATAADDETTEAKVCESEYAEINDSSLPRYTDIFKDAGGQEDPFSRASAPPLCAVYETCPAPRATAAASVETVPPSTALVSHKLAGGAAAGPDPHDSNVKEVLQGTADILQRECRQLELRQQQQNKKKQQLQQQQQSQRVPEASKQTQPRRASDPPAVVAKDAGGYYNLATTAGRQGLAGQGQGQGRGLVLGQDRTTTGGEATLTSPPCTSVPSSAFPEREEAAAVLSLTKDDPAVLTAAAATTDPATASTSTGLLPSPVPNPGQKSLPPGDRARDHHHVYSNCDVSQREVVRLEEEKVRKETRGGEEGEADLPLPPPPPSPPPSVPGKGRSSSDSGRSAVFKGPTTPTATATTSSRARRSASQAYETLGQRGHGRDRHEYQPLVRPQHSTASRALPNGVTSLDDPGEGVADNEAEEGEKEEESCFVAARGPDEEGEETLADAAAVC